MPISQPDTKAHSSSGAAHIRNLFFWQKKHQPIGPGFTVIVTGAASGIGKALSLRYATRGVNLILADLNQDGLNATVNECKDHGAPTFGIKTNVTVMAECQAMVGAALEKFGGLDVLVLCAGIGAHHEFARTDDMSIFDRLMKVNFFGYLNCTKAAYEHLCRSSRGLLVAITSFSGEVGLPYRTAYCASKFATTGFLESLRSEMEAKKQSQMKSANDVSFDITIVCPPTINTNLRANSLTTDKRFKGSRSESAFSVDTCVDAIVDAADRRLRKAFFPWKYMIASYFRPLIPDVIDKSIWARAKL